MPTSRQLLEEYVTQAKVMQLSTVDSMSAPAICHLWFASEMSPDRIWFISRPHRHHCAHIRDQGKVAGAMLSSVPTALNEGPGRGATFTGTGRELPTTGVDEQVNAYLARWPKAHNAIDIERLARGEASHRIYEITVNSWILFDEEHFPNEPRQPVSAA